MFQGCVFVVLLLADQILECEDPLAKLAHFKELQAKYAAVKEQRERAESTNRLLQQMPTAGNEETWFEWGSLRWWVSEVEKGKRWALSFGKCNLQDGPLSVINSHNPCNK